MSEPTAPACLWGPSRCMDDLCRNSDVGLCGLRDEDFIDDEECGATSDQTRDHRTPIIKIELQLRPVVPDDAEPYWWGNHTLTFRKHGRPVWEATIPEAAWSSGRTAYVRQDHGFGWVLVLTLMHDKAREVLASIGLPDHAGSPDATEDKGNMHASRWSYWGHDDTDPVLRDRHNHRDRTMT